LKVNRPILLPSLRPSSVAWLDPRRALVIELRFFGGLSVDETAAVLQVSPQRVRAASPPA
jgi:DNA-directed RNA polymerase specialized sigma subunit